MDEIGVIHGRFQMLHLGHMEYLLAGKARCRKLIVGITNPDIEHLRGCGANPHRGTAEANPLTYEERRDMVTGALTEAGVPREDFLVVAFPINEIEEAASESPEAGRSMLFGITPESAKYYMTIYDEWSLEKKELFESLGCTVEVMWTRSNEDKVTSGTEVRARIAAGEPWEELVPPFVYKYVTEKGIGERMRRAQP